MNCYKARLSYAPDKPLIGSSSGKRVARLSILGCASYPKLFSMSGVIDFGVRRRRGITITRDAAGWSSTPLYPQLNLDLLIAGILFHDSGKLWENQFAENGFVMAYDEIGELMGHISIGLELVNSLWRRLSAEQAEEWRNLAPASEDVRMHLLHLIGSHHGEMQFGSPVFPKTPEAMALHYIDNLDARLEMFAAGYATAKPLADRIFERARPLPGNLVKSLEKFQPATIVAPQNDRLL
jgi:3'-5' exoribonuclease